MGAAMSETQMLTLAAALVAAMFGLLCTILGWIGTRIYNKVDEMSKNLVQMAGELHERINGIDRRVTVVETKYEMNETSPGMKCK